MSIFPIPRGKDDGTIGRKAYCPQNSLNGSSENILGDFILINFSFLVIFGRDLVLLVLLFLGLSLDEVLAGPFQLPVELSPRILNVQIFLFSLRQSSFLFLCVGFRICLCLFGIVSKFLGLAKNLLGVRKQLGRVVTNLSNFISFHLGLVRLLLGILETRIGDDDRLIGFFDIPLCRGKLLAGGLLLGFAINDSLVGSIQFLLGRIQL